MITEPVLDHDLKIGTEYLQPDIEKFREIVVASRSLCIFYHCSNIISLEKFSGRVIPFESH